MALSSLNIYGPILQNILTYLKLHLPYRLKSAFPAFQSLVLFFITEVFKINSFWGGQYYSLNSGLTL
jgi:hypothetical protein